MKRSIHARQQIKQIVAATSYAIDPLEPRLLLANVSWLGAPAGDWNDPTKWSGGAVPTANDTVFIVGSTVPTSVAVTVSGATPAISELFAVDCTITLLNPGSQLTTSGGGFFTRSVFNINDGSMLQTDGSLVMSRTDMNWSGGTLDGNGSIRIESATGSRMDVVSTSLHILSTVLENKRDLAWTAGNIALDGGQIINSGDATFTAANSGVIVGTGDVRIQGGVVKNNLVIGDGVSPGGSLTWTGGAMDNTGTTTIRAGATLNISGDNKILSRTLNNQGTAIWFGGNITIGGTTGASLFHNFAGASLTISAPGSNALGFVGSAGTTGNAFQNDGTLIKTGDGQFQFIGTAAGAMAFNNLGNGSVIVTAGIFEIQGGGNSTGNFFLNGPGAQLQLSGLPYDTATSCGISGAATGAGLTILSGTSTLFATIDVPSLTTKVDVFFGAQVTIRDTGTIDGNVRFNQGLGLGASSVTTLVPTGFDPLAAPGQSPPPHVMRIQQQTFNVPPNALVNVNDNAVVVDYTGGRVPSPLPAIQSQIAAARAGGNWTGFGLSSIEARNSYEQNTTLAAIESTDYRLVYGNNALFAGQQINGQCVLLRYTYYGDTDLNGVVNFDDYARVDAGFNNGRAGWFNGDLDYNGSVNFDDYSLLDLAFNTQRPRQVKFTNPAMFGVGALPHTSESADLNGDGKPELIATNQEGRSISILRNMTPTNSTKASFAAPQTVPAHDLPVSVAPIDLNGDGKIDLAIANAGPTPGHPLGELQVLINTTPQDGTATTFTFAPAQFDDSGEIRPEPNAASRTRFVIVLDVNRDGKPDLATANFWQNTISIFLNTGNPADLFTTQQVIPNLTPPTADDPVVLTTGDYNGDNNADLVVANQNSASVTVLLNTTPAFGTSATFNLVGPYAAGDTPRFVTTADLNRDQRLDLIVADHGANAGNNSIAVLLGNGNGTFAPKQDIVLGVLGRSVKGPISLDVGDLNGDNRPDLAVSNFNSDNLTVMLNTTPANAPFVTFGGQSNLQAGTNPIFVNLVDLNGDGKLDLAAADYYANAISVLLNILP